MKKEPFEKDPFKESPFRDMFKKPPSENTSVKSAMKEYEEFQSHRKAFGEIISKAYELAHFTVDFGKETHDYGHCDIVITLGRTIEARCINSMQEEAKRLEYEYALISEGNHNFRMMFRKVSS